MKQSTLGITSTMARKQLYMPVAHTLGPPYGLGTHVPRDTGVVRGEALHLIFSIYSFLIRATS